MDNTKETIILNTLEDIKLLSNDITNDPNISEDTIKKANEIYYNAISIIERIYGFEPLTKKDNNFYSEYSY